VEITMSDVETDPVRVFGNVLRVQRTKVGLTQADLAAVVFCSPSLISAIENGTRPAKLDLVERLDAALQSGGVLRSVWPLVSKTAYPEWFKRVAGLEAQATKIFEWEPRCVAGLLQTAEYARAIMRAGRPSDDDESIERDVMTRLDRQQILTRESPPVTFFIVDESVLHRPFGGARVMHNQLRRLAEAAALPNVILQVLPFEATDQPGADGPMRILEFDGGPSVAYTEGVGTGRVIEIPSEVAGAMTYFDRVRASALPRAASLNMLVRFGEKYDVA
jgi:transcriptional regulator with XRE-family HTH domain